MSDDTQERLQSLEVLVAGLVGDVQAKNHALKNRIDAIETTQREIRSGLNRLERIALGLARQINTPEWMHPDVEPDPKLLMELSSEITKRDGGP